MTMRIFKLLVVIGVGVAGALDSCSSTDVTSAPPSSSTAHICTANSKASCSSLSDLYDSGDATCAGDETSWDISSCHVLEHINQFVYPRDIDPVRWPNAVCNDGTSSLFTIAFPTGYNALTPAQKAATPYQIDLQGGGQCVPGKDAPTDQEPCEKRSKQFLGNYNEFGEAFPKSSSADPQGDLQPYQDKPADQPLVDKGLENAIKIWAHYCSSDIWSGQNTNAISDNLGTTVDASHYGPDGILVTTINQKFTKWPMTGYEQVTALLDVVTERFGMRDSNSSLRIHLRGQSAGGWGVMVHLSTLAARFPNALSRTQNGGGAIQGSSWQAWLPITFTGQTRLNGTTQFSPTLPRVEGHAAPTVWNSYWVPACKSAGKTRGECLFSTTLYDYNSSMATTSFGKGLGIPLLIYMNRQDEGNYMPFAGIIPLNDQGVAVDIHGNTNTSDAAQQSAARIEWIRKTNIEMGIQSEATAGLLPGTVTTSSRVKWLFTPNDPRITLAGNVQECNVHAPLDWLAWKEFDGSSWMIHNLGNTGSPPDTMGNTLENMTERFWDQKGLSMEVHAYNGPGTDADTYTSVNYVTKTTNCEK